MILVTFAVPFESEAFRRRAASRSVRILHTGVGMDAARVALENAVCESLPDRVIASGFAGALLPELRIGEIVCDIQTARWRHARFGTSSAILTNAEAKRIFRAQNDVETVDMETSAIREVCESAGIPLTGLRAISDRAEDDLGLPVDLLENLAARPVRSLPNLIWTLLGDGGRRKAFFRLVRDCRTAQLALADALEREIDFHLGS